MKRCILRCWDCLSGSRLDWGFYLVSIARTVSQNYGALILSVKFRSFEVALNLHKCTKQPRMDYCYIV